jgi:hypothetical protein
VKRPRSYKLVRVACVLALLALPLMLWSIFDPHVWPVLLALSAGQVLGTGALVLFLIVVARDLQIERRMEQTGVQTSIPPPPGLPSLPPEEDI